VGGPRVSRVAANAVIVFLLATACTGGGPPKPTPPVPRRGGAAVFGAEQWPECLNPITACASASWTHYAVLQHILPRAMKLDLRGHFVASELLVKAPTLDNGGLTQNPFTVRFKINPRAVWDDGSPITSADFDFTWRAIVHTVGAYATEGYDLIRAIDTSDPRVAAVRFRQPLARWATLFGGVFGYVLKGATFPNADPEEPNLRDEMQGEIPFAAGPFRLDHWDRRSAVLVRNDRYFGRTATLDKVTFVALTYQGRERTALRSGQVAAIFPMPPGPGLLAALNGEHVKTVTADGIYFEALWLNHAEPPLDDPVVREAFMYAIDRQAIVDKVIRPNHPGASILNCGFVAFRHLGPWCRARPFERFTYDPARARRILESDGYNCSAAFCSKDDRLLKVEYWTNGSNTRRALTQQLVVDQARLAGFAIQARNTDGSRLFGDEEGPRYPIADFAASMYGDPSVTELFACDEIPTKENHYYGGNFNRWCDSEADRLMRQADREIDPRRRLALMEQVYELQARDFVSLPLYVLPVISAWRTDRIAGPIGQFSSTPYGMFFNMNEWYVPAPAQT
jgi:peptide/nickel transport system substrate-binding protein